jgi:NAD(P)-dependent dehydrogenase (short-subunit alcohol dehydrogenase family)
MVEEITEEQLREQLETNLFGALAVTQSALPILREQQAGHIVQISTIGGILTFPSLGGYHASKWALEGMSEALAQEVAAFGIKVTLVEPGGYATDWAGSSATFAPPNPAYDHVREELARRQGEAQMADPTAVGSALLKVVDAEEPPLRVFFGSGLVQMVENAYGNRLQAWKEWQPVSESAQGMS